MELYCHEEALKYNLAVGAKAMDGRRASLSGRQFARPLSSQILFQEPAGRDSGCASLATFLSHTRK